MSGAQVPGLPPLQLSHWPRHGRSQQTPSRQLPLAHGSAELHWVPSGLFIMPPVPVVAELDAALAPPIPDEAVALAGAAPEPVVAVAAPEPRSTPGQPYAAPISKRKAVRRCTGPE